MITLVKTDLTLDEIRWGSPNKYKPIVKKFFDSDEDIMQVEFDTRNPSNVSQGIKRAAEALGIETVSAISIDKKVYIFRCVGSKR